MDRVRETVFQHVPVPEVHIPALVESICPKCHKSVGTSPVPFVLRIVENAHKCIKNEE